MSLWRDRLARLREHPTDAWLLTRVVVLGAIVHPLVHRMGVAHTARLVRPVVHTRPRPARDWLESRRVRVLIEFADPRTSHWTEGACLERSLTLYRLLNLEGVAVDLVIGLRSEGGVVDGHAWLTYHGEPILERRDPVGSFRPTLCFPSPFKGRDIAFPQILSQPL